MWFADTANDLLKQRNAADSAWISILTLSTGAVSNAAIADDAVTLAKMAAGTDGELITYDTSGDPTTVPTGSSGEVLTSNGAGTTPTFQAAAAGGKVLQVVNFGTTTGSSSSSSSYVNSNIVKSITPSLTSSKILVLVSFSTFASGGAVDSGMTIRLKRNSTELPATEQTMYISNSGASGSEIGGIASVSYLDSPATTSSIEYRLIYKGEVGSTYHAIRYGQDITLMEIGV